MSLSERCCVFFFFFFFLSGIFCTNNAQAPSLFSNVTLTMIYHLTEEGHCCPKLFQHTIVCLLVLRWKRGRELVHCLYKKFQTCLPTSRRPAKPYFFFFRLQNHRSLTKWFLSLARKLRQPCGDLLMSTLSQDTRMAALFTTALT